MRIIFADKGASNISIANIQAPTNITDFMPGMYVSCVYMMMIGLLEMLQKYLSNTTKYMSNLWKRTKNVFCGPLKMIDVGFLCSWCLGHVESLLVQGNSVRTYSISNIQNGRYSSMVLS